MIYSADELILRLSQYAKDYKKGNVLDIFQICMDCEVASNMIRQLKTSKHTKKRRAQRLQKKISAKNKKIEDLEAEINLLKA